MEYMAIGMVVVNGLPLLLESIGVYHLCMCCSVVAEIWWVFGDRLCQWMH